MPTIERIFDFPYYQLNNKPLENAFNTIINGKWESISTQNFIEKIEQLGRALLKSNIKKDSKVAVISSYNCTNWHILDTALGMVGAQMVPVYPTSPESIYEYIFNHAEVEYCFLSDEVLFEKVKNILPKCPNMKEIFSFEKINGCKHISEMFERGSSKENQEELEQVKATIKPDDLATIIYTSGTTGTPKGVMLTHKNLTSNVMECEKRLHIRNNAVALSFLPTCHVYERMMVYLYIYKGIEVHFAESIETIADNMQTVQPHIMTVVPRLLEKVYAKICAKGDDLTGVKKKLFFWSVKVGSKNKSNLLHLTRLIIAKKLIFSKWKVAFGGRLENIVSGSAALQPELAMIFSSVGFNIFEGYGLTETSPVITVGENIDKGLKLGTVGKPLKSTEVKIAEDGEILCKGPSLMKGYYKNPKLTKEVIDKNGYFHTGDIGKFDEEGFLQITDRKKEMFKTSGGKYIAPQLIENEMKRSPFIEQIMVVGAGEKMPAAIVQPEYEYLRKWAETENIEFKTNESLVQNPKVIKLFEAEIEKYNAKFGHWEQIKKFTLSPNLWTIENELLTPTMKMKRKTIKEKYQHLYDKMYKED